MFENAGYSGVVLAKSTVFSYHNGLISASLHGWHNSMQSDSIHSPASTALQQVRIVLVGTSHPGNIGAAARAMKTMGVTQLHLVAPAQFPHGDATALASGADDILANAVVTNELSEAIADCQLVIATSARSRRLPWPMLTPSQAARQLVSEAHSAPVALVFGREKSGLSNPQLQLCQYHVQIPSEPNYGVLNVAAAVQVLCYELRQAALAPALEDHYEAESGYPTHAALELFFAHLEQTLCTVEFLDVTNPRQVMPRLRRLFQRARLENMEVGILRGFFSLIEQQCTKRND